MLPFLGLYLAGGRINVSPSLPMGLYWRVDKNPEVGDIVQFRHPDNAVFNEAERRNYIGKNQYMLKILFAAAGDVVRVDDAGVSVNGRPIPNTRPKSHDRAGRPLPVYRTSGRRLDPDEVFLLSNHMPDSFDGRYFGPQKRESLAGVVRPGWTWEN